jgi:UDP-N-acetylglucosamine acyltransferase
MVKIHPTAVIGPNVEIEDDVYIGPLCIIGFPAEWKGGEQEDKGVTICKGSRLTGLVTVDSGVERRTVVGRNAYLMKGVHVGHDALLQEDVTISCGARIGGHTIIGSHCNIGLNAVIHQKQIIAAGVMVGMGAVVTKGLITSPFDVVVGNPAKWIKKNERHPLFPPEKKLPEQAESNSKITNDSNSLKPFTPEEQAIMDKIVDAHNAFIALGTEHSSEPDRWLCAIHDLQNILIYRAIKRLFPNEFK